ncbi:hypothetical protein D3H65_31630 [Paraflavitalea soli]|uniref:DUF5362 domain-containing protein n=1 Tax=Paraflavitalea soli TaxID=2315862 RepID=A0A3B7MUR4_9BACT|nr:hypothetical protein [Paraflavitalea soli]AXY78272.1 hypothetical protein D3H65_31630 [Paraflavitalea soli]
MENNSNQGDNLFNLSIEGAARELLQTAATWARIIAIVGFISGGLSLIGLIFGSPQANAAVAASSTLISLPFIALGVIINVFLFKFATNILGSLANMSQVQFNEGINNLRTYFKIIGILIIIGLSLVVLIVMFYGLGRGLR